MSNISIVTAFYDIGRGDWTPDKGLPHYLHRTTDTYIERFSHMAQLNNEIIVFSTPDIFEKLRPLNTKNNIKFVSFDIFQQYSELKKVIEDVQKDESYQSIINPSQRLNPEYWNADYVLVNFLKSTFVNLAIEHKLISNELVAWLDFGYCRTPDKIPASKSWSYDFNPNKMHLFNYMDYGDLDLIQVISNNIVYILGAKLVGGKTVWPKFSELMNTSINQLLVNKLIDDDQTLMLMSTLLDPNLFELHKIPDHQKGLDAFVVLQDFNKEA